jgi:hypothetical protein
MCTISLDKALNITIFNQYPNLELKFPVYFSNETTYCVPPNQQADTGNATKTSFGISYKQEDFKCVSLYKLQRKNVTKSDNRSDNSTASADNTATNMYLLVAWIIENYDHKFCVWLIECTNDFTWDEDKLWALYSEYNDQFHMNDEHRIITWSMHDNAVMKTKLDITYGPDYQLDIIISKETREHSMLKPTKIDPKRLVLSLSMLIVLMYAVRLNIRPSAKLDIYNQCSNIDLVSLVYIIDNKLEWHRAPNHKVCAGDTMRSGFIIKLDDGAGGALTYRLQRKQKYKSTQVNEDTSSTVQLLVIWSIESMNLYADVLLVEHDKRLDWSKDNLRNFYKMNVGHFMLYPDSTTETWSLNDNIALMITSEIMSEGRTLSIIITEIERYNDVRIPAHINLER